MQSTTNKRCLTPSQQKVKQPRPVHYSSSQQLTFESSKKLRYVDPEDGRYIILLYVTCGLGYSAIREVMGYKNDKIIEDVVRQHMLGRGKVDCMNGELECPPINPLNEFTAYIIKTVAKYRGTLNSEYVSKMLATGRWWDQPVKPKVHKCKCGYTITDSSFKHCPMCGIDLSFRAKPNVVTLNKLFNVEKEL